MPANGTPLRVFLTKPCGVCAGVRRAAETVERALAVYGPPVYVRHEIIHDRHVVDGLRARGAVFVDDLAEVPDGALVVFGAHGVAEDIEHDCERRGHDVVDATCPLVLKLHKEARRFAERAYDVVLIGRPGDDEVEGIASRIPGRVHVVSQVADVGRLEVADPARVACIMQTTLGGVDTQDIVAALKHRFPRLAAPDGDACSAVHDRQKAALRLARRVEAVFVVGTSSSTTTRRLTEIVAASGVPTRLVETAAAIDPAALDGLTTVGLAAGPSTPDALIEAVLARIKALRAVELDVLDGPEEHVRFRLPSRLRHAGERPQAAGPSSGYPGPGGAPLGRGAALSQDR
ncbi:4-hydroxy-3-methylbut-2-enyl diphosphate reductase [Blastochloris sulfoviridis]|uniref:4-hydroxy-3-methylbut-2-enyl diphosphate reductase n=1 Tax=Blastochloris sulfoviridis TaxID=50712 RepID=A0A5M6I5G8_9HYPH|nr:4-hydroxy-3-methylbut-2-enyl diphosphate reductase [Blastochloris sulfoviridis]KAA5603049.1 4-hydroxy-3-methylbut-2-enyl diphosphate reductase [Blastochloris sulfoviridis]